ncbi:MAG: SagB/ThcOx family dehydrogenase [Candidatus Thiodiazotropha endolucinida]|nr:SagB/ThcOx family dehydrogenase [Candidatus Thiodiazotropha endolucinida]
MTDSRKNATLVIDYHERTKHRFDGYAKGPETIDWDAQPNLFRRFEGAPCFELPLQESDTGPSYASLFNKAQITPQEWNHATISRLLQFSITLSAWKQYGTSRWSLRCNPSSGNLHPTETYLILMGVEGFQDGLYHYRVDVHQLELRCRYPETESISKPLLLLGFSSVHWQEAWKYGERAYRYCHLDLGHALAAVSYAAVLVGYRVTPLQGIDTNSLKRLLGLDRSNEFYPDEAEQGDMLLAFHTTANPTRFAVDEILHATLNGEWHGKANRLDPKHLYEWPAIDEVAQAAARPAGISEELTPESWPDAITAADHPLSLQPAQRLFLQRRSAQSYDAESRISGNDFFRMLDRLLPRIDLPPWSALTWQPRLHLILIVHGVDGLPSGLYLLARRKHAREMLKNIIRDDLLWETVDAAPSHLPLFHLVQAKSRRAAMQLSCLQAIAGDSAFSLGMLAEFDTLNEAPWRYNELFWEAGMISQSLYLEAEAIGLRGTGIGCFFDDGVHEMLGIQDRSLQSIYHFTVGTPLNDPRLATLPPYQDKRVLSVPR